jgi:branched-chain amino acid transport system ATP-binding protein
MDRTVLLIDERFSQNPRFHRIPYFLLFIIPYLTVLENLKLGTYTSRAWKVWKETLKNVFEIFPELKERKNQIAHTLSGGEQQMLAIGRALMTRPILILLDEISLGLAPIVVAKIYDALKELNDKGGVSMVIVEQCITKVAEIADNIIIQEEEEWSITQNPRIEC